MTHGLATRIPSKEEFELSGGRPYSALFTPRMSPLRSYRSQTDSENEDVIA